MRYANLWFVFVGWITGTQKSCDNLWYDLTILELTLSIFFICQRNNLKLSEICEIVWQFGYWKPFEVSIRTWFAINNSLIPHLLQYKQGSSLLDHVIIHHIRRASYWFRPKIITSTIYLSNPELKYSSTYSRYHDWNSPFDSICDLKKDHFWI